MPLMAELEAQVRAHLRAGDTAAAAEALLRGYGPEVLSFLCVKLANDADADDAFSLFCEDVWRGLGAFRGEASFRTWSYKVAYRAAHRYRRSADRRVDRFADRGTDAFERVAAEVRTTTAVFRRTEPKDRFQ